MMEFNRAGLLEFMKRSEGAVPPVFVGRDDKLGKLMAAARHAWNSRGITDGSLSKRTHIIQGAPGAGKSTLLRELSRRLQEEEDGPGPRTRMLYVNSADYTMDPALVLSDIMMLAGLDSDNWKRLVASMASRMAGMAATVAIGPVGLGISGPDRSDDRPHSIGQLNQKLPPDRWAAPIMLAIDEFQNFPEMDQSAPALQLKSLHEGTFGLPLTLVLAGLGDTNARASQMGLTRGKTIHPIGAAHLSGGNF